MNFERLNIYRFVLYCFGLGIFLLKHFPVLRIYCVYFLSKLHKNTTCTFTSLSMHSQKFFSKVPLLNHHLYTSAIFKSREVKFKPYRWKLTPSNKSNLNFWKWGGGERGFFPKKTQQIPLLLSIGPIIVEFLRTILYLFCFEFQKF